MDNSKAQYEQMERDLSRCKELDPDNPDVKLHYTYADGGKVISETYDEKALNELTK